MHEIIERIVGTPAPAPVPHSLLLIELTFALEDLFQMKPITLEEAPSIGSIGELSAYIAEKVGSAGAVLPTADTVQLAIQHVAASTERMMPP